MAPRALYMCPSTLLPDLFAPSDDQVLASLDASCAADMAGISFWSLHHFALTGRGWSTEAVVDAIAERGLDVGCIEALPAWANEATAGAAVDKSAATIELCAVYGAPTVAAVTLDPEIADFGQATRNLAAIADEAARHDAAVCIEFLPWTGLPDVGTVWELIRRAERDNVGLLIDSWHWHHQPGGPGGANADELRSIPGERIMVFQLCDAVDTPYDEIDDPMTECMTNRALPGQGVLDHSALFELFRSIEAEPIVAPEVFNSALLAKGVVEMCAEVAAACRETLADW